MRRFLTVLAGITMGILWILSSAPANANHHPTDYRAAENNNAGYYFTTEAQLAWTQNNGPIKFCVGLASGSTERQAAFDAISNWEAQFSFPFNEFQHACGSGQRLEILHNEGPWGGYETCTQGVDAVGCYYAYYVWDSTRYGYYTDTMRIWLNTRGYNYTYRGAKGVIAHELGHAYGLGDMYLHDGSCNPGVTTLMNRSVSNAQGLIDGICNGNLDTVQSWDFSKAHWFNVMNISSFQHQNVTVMQGTSSSMIVSFDDYAPTEDRYRARIQYWNGSSWVTGTFYYKYSYIAFGDMQYPGSASFTWAKPYYLPTAWYRACLELHSDVTGYAYEKCSGIVYLSG